MLTSEMQEFLETEPLEMVQLAKRAFLAELEDLKVKLEEIKTNYDNYARLGPASGGAVAGKIIDYLDEKIGAIDA